MQFVIYLLIALAATTAGAATGMGGGVIIKPLLDLLGHYDAATINMLSSFTVLTMAVVSVGRHLRAKTKIDMKMCLLMAVGAVAGGLAGDRLLLLLLQNESNKGRSFVVQNAVLAGLIVLVYLYMLAKKRLPRPDLTGKVWAYLLTGCVLGLAASFLGIGGGPINVALITFLFACSTKEAAVGSLVIILFSQLAKAGSFLLAGGFAMYDFSMLPVMMVGAVAGGLIGSKIHSALKEERVELLFNIMQAVIIVICIFNIVRYMG